MKFKLMILIAGVILLLWLSIVIASGAGWNPSGTSWNFANTGSFGDSFGPLSAAMGAAAAIGAFLAWNEQRREIGRLKAGEEQARLDLAVSRDEQTFFNLIRMFQDIVSRIDIQRSTGVEKSGQDAFAYLLSRVDARIQLGVEKAYSRIFETYINDLGHYFRTLYNIIAFIDRSNLIDKYFYVKIIRSMLSDSELAFVGLNCAYGEGVIKFKPLVEKYSLLKNLSFAVTNRFLLEECYERSAFEKVIYEFMHNNNQYGANSDTLNAAAALVKPAAEPSDLERSTAPPPPDR